MALAKRDYPTGTAELVKQAFPGSIGALRAVESGERSAVDSIRILTGALKQEWSASDVLTAFKGLRQESLPPQLRELRSAAERAVHAQELLELIESDLASEQPIRVGGG